MLQMVCREPLRKGFLSYTALLAWGGWERYASLFLSEDIFEERDSRPYHAKNVAMVHLSLQHRAGFDYVRVRDSTDSESEKGTPRRIVSLLKFLKMFGGGNFENSCIETGLKRVSQRFVSAQVHCWASTCGWSGWCFLSLAPSLIASEHLNSKEQTEECNIVCQFLFAFSFRLYWGVNLSSSLNALVLRVGGKHKKSNFNLFFLWFFFYDFDLWIGKNAFWFYENFMIFLWKFYDFFMKILWFFQWFY
jgi:hypothetical protein